MKMGRWGLLRPGRRGCGGLMFGRGICRGRGMAEGGFNEIDRPGKKVTNGRINPKNSMRGLDAQGLTSVSHCCSLSVALLQKMREGFSILTSIRSPAPEPGKTAPVGNIGNLRVACLELLFHTLNGNL